MEGNPYSNLIIKIRNDILKLLPVSYRLGTVISVDPLIVDVAGIVQDADALQKDSLLGDFSAGERLLLLPIEDDQRYIIICKVVNV